MRVKITENQYKKIFLSNIYIDILLENSGVKNILDELITIFSKVVNKEEKVINDEIRSAFGLTKTNKFSGFLVKLKEMQKNGLTLNPGQIKSILTLPKGSLTNTLKNAVISDEKINTLLLGYSKAIDNNNLSKITKYKNELEKFIPENQIDEFSEISKKNAPTKSTSNVKPKQKVSTTKTIPNVAPNVIGISEVINKLDNNFDQYTSYLDDIDEMGINSIKGDILTLINKKYPNGINPDTLDELIELKLKEYEKISKTKLSDNPFISSSREVVSEDGKKLQEKLKLAQMELANQEKIQNIQKTNLEIRKLRTEKWLNKTVFGTSIVFLALLDLLIGQLVSGDENTYRELFITIFTNVDEKNDIYDYFKNLIKNNGSISIDFDGETKTTSSNDINLNRALYGQDDFKISVESTSNDDFFYVTLTNLNIDNKEYKDLKVKIDYELFNEYSDESDSTPENQTKFIKYVQGESTSTKKLDLWFKNKFGIDNYNEYFELLPKPDENNLEYYDLIPKRDFTIKGIEYVKGKSFGTYLTYNTLNWYDLNKGYDNSIEDFKTFLKNTYGRTYQANIGKLTITSKKDGDDSYYYLNTNTKKPIGKIPANSKYVYTEIELPSGANSSGFKITG
jgi:hypothetical protein